jgi:hypothetical protein
MLVEQHQAVQAFSLADKLSKKYFGNKDFDMAYANAAFSVKNYPEALLAYKRVLMKDPGNNYARIGLAMSYNELGVYAMAKYELNEANKYNATKEINDTISKLLSVIESREENRQGTLKNKVYVSLLGGYDSNINSAAANDFIDVPVYNINIPIGPDLQAKKDSFIGGAFGFNGYFSATPKLTFIWNGNIKYRDFITSHLYDTTNSGILAGAAYSIDNFVLKAIGSYNLFYFDKNRIQEAQILSLSVTHPIINEKNFVKLFYDIGKDTYPQSIEIDLHSRLYGVTFEHSCAKFNASFSGFLIDNKAQNDNYKYNGYKGYGLQVMANYKLNEKYSLFAGALFKHSLYNQENPLFLETRKDNFFTFSGGVDWRFSHAWNAEVGLSYDTNSSNIKLNVYNRTVVGLNITRSFG